MEEENKNMRKSQHVMINRSELAPSLAKELPSFIFYNVGTIQQIEGKRVQVKFNIEDKFWFDIESVRNEKDFWQKL